MSQKPVDLSSVERAAISFAECKPLFFAMGETPRQQIMLLLAETEDLNVNQLAARLPLSRPAISHHLKILRQAGLVDSRQAGTENRYFLTADNAIGKLERFVEDVKRCS